MANRHLSYNEFKNRFGDIGVTFWTKYNWLDNYNFGIRYTPDVNWNQLFDVNRNSGTVKETNGITYIVNNNGSVSVFGQATARATSQNFNYGQFEHPRFIAGHKYYGNSGSEYIALHDSEWKFSLSGSGIITVNTSTTEDYNTEMFLDILNTTYPYPDRVLNITFFPLVIDLTQMFGAGNEPTDVNDSRIQWAIDYAKYHPEYNAGTNVPGPVVDRFVKVPYVEFTGTQWVDTGLTSTLLDKWTQDAVIQFTDINSNQLNGATGGFYWGVVNNQFANTTFNSLTPRINADTNKHHIVSVIEGTKQYNYLYVDDAKYRSSRTDAYSADAKFYIGAISPTGNLCKQKIYSYKILKNDELVRSFVPVFDKEAGTYELYDLVSQDVFSSNTELVGPKLFRFTEDNLSNINYYGLYYDLHTFYIDIGNQLLINSFTAKTDNSKYVLATAQQEVNFSFRPQDLGNDTYNTNRCYIFLQADSEAEARQILLDNQVVIIIE